MPRRSATLVPVATRVAGVLLLVLGACSSVARAPSPGPGSGEAVRAAPSPVLAEAAEALARADRGAFRLRMGVGVPGVPLEEFTLVEGSHDRSAGRITTRLSADLATPVEVELVGTRLRTRGLPPDPTAWQEEDLGGDPDAVLEDLRSVGLLHRADELTPVVAALEDLEDLGPAVLRGAPARRWRGTATVADLGEQLGELALTLEAEPADRWPVTAWVDERGRLARVEVAAPPDSRFARDGSVLHLTLDLYDDGAALAADAAPGPAETAPQGDP